MPVSQNGWAALSGLSLSLKSFPWITGKVRRGDVYTILDHFCTWFNREIEPITKAHSWGYAARNIRGSATTISNHASGTAIDLNAPKHPLGAEGTFSSAQAAKIREQLKLYNGVIRWGGDYLSRAQGGRKDEMHLEVNASAAAVANVAARIKAGALVAKPVAKPASTSNGKAWPAVALPATNAHTAASHAAWVKLMADIGYKDADLGKALQRWLSKLGYYTGAIDGNFARVSTKALQKFLKAKGHYKGAIDGARQSMTIKAEIAYLNSQRKHY